MVVECDVKKNTCSMTISFLFLAVYIEFEKLLGDDDQNNVKRLYSEIKKRKGNLSFDVSKLSVLI